MASSRILFDDDDGSMALLVYSPKLRKARIDANQEFLRGLGLA